MGLPLPVRTMEAVTRSPLWLVAEEPMIEELITSLDASRKRIMADPNAEYALSFSRARLETCRNAFAAMIRRGEAKLHKLCELLGERFLSETFDMDSIVVGEVPTTRERFTLSHRISAADLYSYTDLDLGTRQLQRFRVHDGVRLQTPTLVANVVEYQPLSMGRFSVHKVISRIKAEEELWNKVADEIFGLDTLVNRDKQLRELSRFVKDVFGIKFVVDEVADVQRLHDALKDLELQDSDLARYDVPANADTRRFGFVEVKSYMDEGEKRSGWGAMKSVVSWWDKLFEIQVLTLATHHNEREHLTRESHTGHKSRREAVRDQVAEGIPLFKFYRDLLRWLFIAAPNEAAPTFPGVSILVDA